MNGSSLQQYEPPCVNLFITNFCNRRCPFCYLNDWVTDKEDDAHHMTLKSLDALIHWLQRSRVFKVKLAGGEPMLHPHLLDFIGKLVKSRVGIDAILTNGLGDTELYEKVVELMSGSYSTKILKCWSGEMKTHLYASTGSTRAA